jgi:hypothetical protein
MRYSNNVEYGMLHFFGKVVVCSNTLRCYYCTWYAILLYRKSVPVYTYTWSCIIPVYIHCNYWGGAVMRYQVR